MSVVQFPAEHSGSFYCVTRSHSDLSGTFLLQQVYFRFLNCAIWRYEHRTALAAALYHITHTFAHWPEHFAYRVVPIYLTCFLP
jgi:hypothetical protein